MIGPLDFRPKPPTILDLGLRGKLVGEFSTNDTEPTKLLPSIPSDDVLRATVGRIVHFVSFVDPDDDWPPCRAAIVAEASARNDGASALMVISPTGILFCVATYDPMREPGTWHWPERV